jgi:hypothetical protein
VIQRLVRITTILVRLGSYFAIGFALGGIIFAIQHESAAGVAMSLSTGLVGVVGLFMSEGANRT